ncbi:MAG: TylF/MycF/NovP-related O-methyltransferase [Acidimicrobiia bacterium]
MSSKPLPRGRGVLTVRTPAETFAARQTAPAAPPAKAVPAFDVRLMRWLRDAYTVLSLPVVVVFLFFSKRIHPSYGMTWSRKFALALRMYRTTRKVETSTSYKAHLAMAAKLLEIDPKLKGVVVECGCWRGGSTANLSLVCDIVGRTLVVYDSFEGLPPSDPRDKYAWPEGEGFLRGDLEVVRDNVHKYGAVERCEFRKGWFADTLPQHREPIVLCFLDVDYEASMHDCIVNLWPHVTERGYVFIDEFARVDYCALFFSERFWKDHFDTYPPGLLGVGTGVGVGQYFLGPLKERPLIQAPASVAYTRKDFYGQWDFACDDIAPD